MNLSIFVLFFEHLEKYFPRVLTKNKVIALALENLFALFTNNPYFFEITGDINGLKLFSLLFSSNCHSSNRLSFSICF